MLRFKNAVVVAASLLALVGCAKSAGAPAADAAADEAAIRAMAPAWFKAYNAGDADALTALYADDAVLNPPGAPAARGHTAIHDFLAKDIAASKDGGFTLNNGATPEAGLSGDLGWDWNTFSVTDKSGKTVDTGKYVTVYHRAAGKWLIIRDTYNSDTPPAPAAAPAPKKAPAKK
jgi:uncharacterized protein (TIGR02246 family)